jgi:glycerol-3-phosphate dehydrogenase
LEREGESDSKDRTYNYAAALFSQGAVELGQMMRVLGGRPETSYGLAGVGDMYVTSQGCKCQDSAGHFCIIIRASKLSVSMSL